MAASGTLTIPAGQTTGTITVLVKGDRLGELDESFIVELSSPTNATVADGQGVGIIVDDEPRISISDMPKKEGRKGQTTQFIFTVTLSAAYDKAVTVSFQTVNGTAKTNDQDYVAKPERSHSGPARRRKESRSSLRATARRRPTSTFSWICSAKVPTRCSRRTVASAQSRTTTERVGTARWVGPMPG